VCVSVLPGKMCDFAPFALPFKINVKSFLYNPESSVFKKSLFYGTFT
jgi:hypothetical protein